MNLCLSSITCVRGDRTLFQDLSIKLGGGEALVVRGPNGSGKSSLLRLMAGLLRPDAGKVEWTGAGSEGGLQTQLHYLGHLDGLKPALTVRESLTFWAGLLGGGDPDLAIKAWKLNALAQMPCGILSAGQRRRVALAKLGLAARPLWLLDEPTGPLDEAGTALVAEAVRVHCLKGGIAVIATHRALPLEDAQTLDLGSESEGA